jgi:GTPase
LQFESDKLDKLDEVKAENDYGNCEYKLKFDNPTLNRVDHLTTQMIFRLNEGIGNAIYRIGVEDNGVVLGITPNEIKETLSVLFYMARNQNAKIMIEYVRRGI